MRRFDAVVAESKFQDLQLEIVVHRETERNGNRATNPRNRNSFEKTFDDDDDDDDDDRTNANHHRGNKMHAHMLH